MFITLGAVKNRVPQNEAAPSYMKIFSIFAAKFFVNEH